MDPRTTELGARAQAEPGGSAPLELSAYLGPDASFVGTLSLAGTVRIDGSIDGELLGPSLVILGPTARVRGKIQAGSVVVLGAQVTADIDVRGAIELRQGATVVGTLTAAEIHMDPDIEFSGKCDLHPSRGTVPQPSALRVRAAESEAELKAE
jgi:cytoskeletal protein CcmA (bactofilin family)